MHFIFGLRFLLFLLSLNLCLSNFANAQIDSSKQQKLIEIPDSSIQNKSNSTKSFNKNHSPKKALILSFALPGAGQIYNRKFWKLPIVYAGLGGLGYLAVYNGSKYQCYRKSYLAMVDDDPLTLNTCDPNQSAANMKLFRDSYRRNYEFSVVGLFGFYLLTAADAFVDAHLKNFDIGDDLSLKIKPDLDLPIYGQLNSSTTFLSAGISFEFNFKSQDKKIERPFY